jgi:hypothetical protein
MKQIRQLILGIILLLPSLMSAQEQIKGNVKDEAGVELPGVSILGLFL